MVAELSLQVAGGPDAPSEARSALRRFHPELPAELMQVVALLASELVANAVKHAASGLVRIRFQVAVQQVRVEVEDEGPGFTPIPKAPEPGTIGGWGLHLVNELSSRWGVMEGPSCRVWFEIDR